MMKKKWSTKETSSLITTLNKHHLIHDALRVHNKLWKACRTIDSAINVLRRLGHKGYDQFLRTATRRKTDDPVEDQVRRLHKILAKRPHMTVSELCDRLDLPPTRLENLIRTARDMGYQISTPTNTHICLDMKPSNVDRLAVYKLPIEPVRGELVFAVASDIHFASKMHRRECLEDFVDIAYEEFGVRRILVPGDVVAGINMYREQLSEITQPTFEGQVDEAVDGLPRKKGLEWEMIGGNHDASFVKAAGADIIKVIASRRADVHDHGRYSALLDLEPPGGVKRPLKVEIYHPDKAGAYALTYHMQKEIERIPGGMKPHMLFCGHRHEAVFLPDYRGVAGFECGTFEDQTDYLKRKHITPHIGGWIIRVGLTKDGSPKTMTPTWVRYFHSRRGALTTSDRDGNDVRMSRSIGMPVGDSAA